MHAPKVNQTVSPADSAIVIVINSRRLLTVRPRGESNEDARVFIALTGRVHKRHNDT
jgi:hypothetical protein